MENEEDGTVCSTLVAHEPTRNGNDNVSSSSSSSLLLSLPSVVSSDAAEKEADEAEAETQQQQRYSTRAKCRLSTYPIGTKLNKVRSSHCSMDITHNNVDHVLLVEP